MTNVQLLLCAVMLIIARDVRRSASRARYLYDSASRTKLHSGVTLTVRFRRLTLAGEMMGCVRVCFRVIGIRPPFETAFTLPHVTRRFAGEN
jgi:hypothetical protein